MPAVANLEVRRLRQDFGEFDQVAERVAEEGEAPADRGKLERFSHDRHSTRPQRINGLVDAFHSETEVMVASVFQAVAKICIGTDVHRRRITAAQDFDIEVIVRCGRDVGEPLVGVVPLGDDTEIQLFDLPALGRFEVRCANGNVVAAHVGERRSAVECGWDEVGHWLSP